MGNKNQNLWNLTCNRPSRVLWIVTHLVGWAPLVVIAVIKASSSSLFSFNFLTKLSIARLAKDSLSPPCRWHMRLWTILRQASAEVGACPDIILIYFSVWPEGQIPWQRSKSMRCESTQLILKYNNLNCLFSLQIKGNHGLENLTAAQISEYSNLLRVRTEHTSLASTQPT